MVKVEEFIKGSTATISTFVDMIYSIFNLFFPAIYHFLHFFKGLGEVIGGIIGLCVGVILLFFGFASAWYNLERIMLWCNNGKL